MNKIIPKPQVYSSMQSELVYDKSNMTFHQFNPVEAVNKVKIDVPKFSKLTYFVKFGPSVISLNK